MNAHQRKKNAKAFIAELKACCDDEKVSSLLEAADDLRKLNKENEQLRQRVAELEILLAEAYADSDEVLRPRVAALEEDRDRWRTDCQTYCDAMHKREEAITSLQAERDALLEANRIACTDIVERHNRIVELKQQRDELLSALYMITKRPVIEAFSIAEAAIASIKEK